MSLQKEGWSATTQKFLKKARPTGIHSLWASLSWCFWTVVLEKVLESPLDCKEIKPVNPKGNQSWIFTGRTDAEAEAPILWPPDVKNWKRPWCWERLKAGAEGDNRGWDGWRASPTQWTWVWASSGSWWRTGKLGLLQSMGLQRAEHDWAPELKLFYPLTNISPFSTPHGPWKLSFRSLLLWVWLF